MLNMYKKLKEESKIELRMNQLEGRVCKVEEKLQMLVHEAVAPPTPWSRIQAVTFDLNMHFIII